MKHPQQDLFLTRFISDKSTRTFPRKTHFVVHFLSEILNAWWNIENFLKELEHRKLFERFWIPIRTTWFSNMFMGATSGDPSIFVGWSSRFSWFEFFEKMSLFVNTRSRNFWVGVFWVTWNKHFWRYDRWLLLRIHDWLRLILRLQLLVQLDDFKPEFCIVNHYF